jgi:hypothetical protein
LSRSTKAAAALLLASFAAAAPAATLPRRLPPVDQCAAEPGFRIFKDALKRSVERRDGDGLLALLAADVTVNFGGDTGRDAFARQWDLKAGSPHELWKQLGAILALGCGKSGSTLVMPSLASQFDSDSDEDVFDKLIVTSSAAELRAAPKPASARIASLSWDVVTALERRHQDDWVQVRLADGRKGWILGRQLRSLLDYRAVIEKRGGQWMITAFVAGD